MPAPATATVATRFRNSQRPPQGLARRSTPTRTASPVSLSTTSTSSSVASFQPVDFRVPPTETARADHQPGQRHAVTVDVPTYLAAWLNRYPYAQAWVDDEANLGYRASEERWLTSLRDATVITETAMVELVRWKFSWRAAQIKPMAAVTGTRFTTTAS